MHEPPILNRSIRSTLRSSSTVSQKMTNDTFPRKNQFLQRVLHRSCSEDGSSGSTRGRRGADECRSVGGSPRLVKRGARRRSEEELVSLVKSTVPRLSSGLGKGEGGRVAVFGGCVMYSGAAYIAAIAALRCGADMVHVFCEKEAGHVIRTFGPELVVHPVLDQEYGMEEIEVWLSRVQSVLVGPGLGRNQSMAGRLSIILEKIKERSLPVVVDADALWHLAGNPGMVCGYPKAVLTPNTQETHRLLSTFTNCRIDNPSESPTEHSVAELAKALGHVTILCKGTQDVVSDGHSTEICAVAGTPRRCGGLGDLLTGLLATLLAWAWSPKTCHASSPSIVAAWGASRLARGAAAKAFHNTGRGMTVQDVIRAVPAQFATLYETETFL